jgi:hypothetical protein
VKNDAAKSLSALGFLTVLDHPQHGLFGGYLVLNTAGRPQEFHCTAPIKANRAQQILYGPTLEPFLYGEQIGRTMLAKATAKVMFVCTDRPAALAVREYVDVPVALVVTDEQPSDTRERDGRILRLDAAHPGPTMAPFQLGRNRLAVPQSAEDDSRLIAERLGALAESFDLAEPFTRIHEAIEEAQRAVR